MHAHSQTNSIFFHKQTLLLLLAYAGIRILSFATANYTAVQAIIAIVLLVIFCVLFYKNRTLAWYMLFGELLLGGAGHFFSFFGISLRTLLLITFIALWIIFSFADKKIQQLHIPHKFFYLLALLGGFVIFAALNGIGHFHDVGAVIRDAIPYTYFLLLIPAYHLFHEEHGKATMSRILITYAIGSALFTLVTLAIFSIGIEHIHGTYYNWFRDFAAGKITDMGNGFFRVVVPEQLLLVPAALFIASLLMRKEKHHLGWYMLLLALLTSLAVGFSRTYWLGLGVGLLVLLYKHSWKQWLRVSVSSVAGLLMLFIIANIGASGGQSTGLELVGLRFGGIARPNTELSAATRSMLLGPIKELISRRPVFGNGLGATITYYPSFRHPEPRPNGVKDLSEPRPLLQTDSSVASLLQNDESERKNNKSLVTTTEFDWGYLEMLAELGAIGTVIFLALVANMMILLIHRIRAVPDYHDLYVGLLAGLVSFLVMTITSPALFHVFGIFYLVLVAAIAIKPHTLLQDIVKILYNVFRKV